MKAALFLVLFLGTSLAQADEEHPNDWYLAIRKDGLSGGGTAADPYNGDTPARLRSLFKNAPNGTRLHLAPGVYPVGTGLTILSGKSLSIIGSNRTTTILKLQDQLPSGVSRSRIDGGIVLDFWGAEQGYTQNSSLYIADLTLDANVDGSRNSINFTADALHTNYPTVVMERVNIVNCGGSENYPAESFHVAVWYPNPDNTETRKWRWYQRLSDIHVVVRSGQTHTATVVGVGTANGQPPMVPAAACSIIENSFFDVSAGQNNTYAIGVVAQNGGVLRNNVVITRDRATAMNADTWDHVGTTIEQNKFFLRDFSSGVRLGSGPDIGTFHNDIIRNNQFFVASPNVVFAIQLNGVSGIEISGNQFLPLGSVTGSLTPIDICNHYVPHKNEAVVIRDNLLDTRLFQFPMAKLQGELREGVITVCDRNRSVDGREADGPANGLLNEQTLQADLVLEHASAEHQVLTPKTKKISIHLPSIAGFLDGRGRVLAGRRFTIINAGKFTLAVVSAQGETIDRVAAGAAITLVATADRWTVFGQTP